MDKERDASLQKLRDAGVVHLKKKNVSSKLLGELLEKHAKNLWVLGFLSKYKTKGEAPLSDAERPADIISHIQVLISEKEKQQEQLIHLTGEKRQIVQWGEFDPKDFSLLSDHGIKLFMYLLPRKTYDRIGNDTKFIIVSKDNNWVKALTVDAEIPDMRAISIPDLPLSEIDASLELVTRRLEEIENEFKNIAFYKKDIEDEDSRLLEEIDYETPGSEKLAENAVKALNEDVLILKKHGILTTGPNIEEACLLAEFVEDIAKTQFISHTLNMPSSI